MTGRTCQRQNAAVSTLADVLGRLEKLNLLTKPSRFQGFVDNLFWKICLPRLRSATSALNRLFSSSKDFKRRSHPEPMPTRTIDSIIDSSGVTKVDLVSITVNTAEVEAVQGMREILKRFKPNLSIAGWLKRDDHVFVYEELRELLGEFPGYRVEVGPVGRVLAWDQAEDTH